MMTENVALGVNFSHRHAEWLNQDPDGLFERLLDELGVRHVRLSVYWDEIAPSAEQLDFAPLRRWLGPMERRGARALVTVGLKAQRWPEFYPPEWLTRAHPLPDGALLDDHPRVVAHLLLMLERVTAFAADYDAIDAWQVENEAFLPSLRNTAGWHFSADLLAREIAVVREADPRRRPIVVNHSSQNCLDRRWQVGLRLADVIAENVYTRKPNRWPWPRYFNVHAIPLFAPPLGRYAATARRHGKGFWITELQAEPWERQDVHALTPAAIGSISPERIRRNLDLVRRAGADRIYLWGAEWWRFTADRDGDTRYWDLARRLFAAQAARPA
jgi:hypothetical protein